MSDLDKNTEWEGWDEIPADYIEQGDHFEDSFMDDAGMDHLIEEALFAQLRDDDAFSYDY